MNHIINVAIADDDILMKQGMISLLKKYDGINIPVDASNGLELLENLKNNYIDLVLLDIEMPIMNGSDTLKIIRKLYPETKVIILSSYFNDELIVKFIAEGAVGYLSKNIEIDQIIEAIKSVYTLGYYFQPEVSIVMARSMADQKSTPSESNAAYFLTSREREVLELLCKELSTREIAKQLNLSTRTIDYYRKSLMDKTHSKNLMGLFNYALIHNIIKKSA